MDPLGVVAGRVSVLDRSDVDTDQIIPKQFLKRVERRGYGQFLFHDWVQDEGLSLEKNPILATGRNFGCGSSREHAAWALEDYGFKVIVAPSFSDIFYSNCTKIGLLPIVLSEDEVKALMKAGAAEVDLGEQTVHFGEMQARFEIDPDTRYRLLNGIDDIAMTLQREFEIDAFERTRVQPALALDA